MKATIIVIGNEVLNGETLDTNSKYIAKELNEIGISLASIFTIPDEKDAIRNTLDSAFQLTDIVITTGGLGPTKDDITRQTLAEYFNCELAFNESTYQFLKSFFEDRNIELSRLNKGQAYIPEKARALPNKEGTAPGILFHEEGKVLVSMPGVPLEMEYLMKYEVIPYLRTNFDLPRVWHKNIRTIGIRESVLAEKIDDIIDNLPGGINLALLPSLGLVKIRLSSSGMPENEFITKSGEVTARINERLEKYIYGYDEDTIPEVIGKILMKHNVTVGTAESCTGGYLAHLITNIPGSSDYFKGGIIAYSNEIKKSSLGVSEETLDLHGAVSEQTARQMVTGAIKALDADLVIATTGIAGPSGGTSEKPVGTVWIAVGTRDKIITRKFHFFKNRTKNIHLSAIMGLDLLRKFLTRMDENGN